LRDEPAAGQRAHNLESVPVGTPGRGAGATRTALDAAIRAGTPAWKRPRRGALGNVTSTPDGRTRRDGANRALAIQRSGAAERRVAVVEAKRLLAGCLDESGSARGRSVVSRVITACAAR
jgi:hypothetical protein